MLMVLQMVMWHGDDMVLLERQYVLNMTRYEKSTYDI